LISLDVSDLQDKIRAWLDEQGYPLEMRVASAFRRAGFRVFQSDYYRDRQSETYRETDIVASADHRVGALLIRVQFVIECKSSRSKPWLLFCSPEASLAPPARVAQRSASKLAAAALGRLAQRKEVQDLDLFQIVDPPAYGATQAFTTGNDVVYSALTGVGSAVSSRARDVDDERRLKRSFCMILFPVVVFEGRLFSCVLKDDAAIAISEKERATLLWRNPVAGEPHTIVSILTDRALKEFAESSISSVKQFFALAESDFTAVLTEPSILPPGLR
jgi:hypothetical protein